MKIAIKREVHPLETRVALGPDSCKKLIKAGYQIIMAPAAGERAYLGDAAYQDVGVTFEADLESLYAQADVLCTVQPLMDHPDLARHEVDLLREGAIVLGTLLPTRNADMVRKLTDRKVTAFATDFIPRTTKAQAMDTLSSMANIAGYKGVLIAAAELATYFPMFMTAAGTVFAARVFVIGAGVAGLQAIATARRLGANVEATDTRSVVKEQIESLGGKFVGVDAGEDAQTAGGYAKELSKEFYEKQAQLIRERCAASDVVITTALIGGVKAPRLITADMVTGMKPGSVIVDLAADAGGNCELTRPGEPVEVNGVKILGPLNLPASMPRDASALYGRNLATFLLEFCKDGLFDLNLEDEIQSGAAIIHAGEIRNALVRSALESGGS